MARVMALRGRKPIVVAIAAQAAATLAVLALVQGHFHLAGTDLPVWLKISVASAAAAATAALFRSSLGWILFMAALPALFYLALIADLPIWVPGAGLLLLVLVLRNVIGDRVPLYLSNRETMDKLSALLAQDRPVSLLDLGCGTGSVPLALARRQTNPDSRFVGIENAPLPYAIARVRAMLAGDRRIQIRWGSLWNIDLADWDLVYAFLSPHPMTELFKKAHAEMSPGSIFISNSFEVPGHEPNRRLPIVTGRATALLLWNIT